jgi:broad specificity phosphatase PhoE
MVKFHLILVRHGYSCANVLKLQKKWWRFTYRDPELTLNALRTARTLSPSFRATLESLFQGQPYLVAASTLLRAQQTALALTGTKSLTIFPYVSEIGPLKTADNTPMRQEDQYKILQETASEPFDIDYEFLEDASGPPSVRSFLQWLLRVVPGLKQERGISEEQPLHIVLVSHGNYISEFLKTFGHLKAASSIGNFTAYDFSIELHPETESIDLDVLGKLEYAKIPSLELSNQCSVDTCRIPVCETRKNRTIPNWRGGRSKRTRRRN